MNDKILSPSFLFRFSVPLRGVTLPAKVEELELDETYRLPCFGELEDGPLLAEVRAGWDPGGLALTVQVRNKKQPPWCRADKWEDSDGLHLWIDTRDAKNVHRANRFCHYFVFLPSGGGRTLNDPVAQMVPINRARELPRMIASSQLRLAARKMAGGYQMQIIIPGTSMTGFDAQDHPRLGFSYAVADRELGWQTFNVGPEFPLAEDPSVWGTVELV